MSDAVQQPTREQAEEWMRICRRYLLTRLNAPWAASEMLGLARSWLELEAENRRLRTEASHQAALLKQARETLDAIARGESGTEHTQPCLCHSCSVYFTATNGLRAIDALKENPRAGRLKS